MAILAIAAAYGCGGDDDSVASKPQDVLAGPANSAGTSAPGAGAGAPVAGTAAPVAGVAAPPAAGAAAPPAAGTTAPPVAGTMAPPAAGTMAPPIAGAMAPPAAGTGATGPSTPAGPNDGDPSKPIVTIPEVACKNDGGGLLAGGANFKMDDRDMIVSYPCNKHEGAPMTFILNLHGTTPVNLHFYQEGYFAASRYVQSRNLIVVTPSSVVEQWGNGDGGADEPHLMKIIDWVYSTFGTKFDIRQMWVGGHSWGAFYTSRFACKPELADKVTGAIIMSGGPTMPACSSKISVIITVAENDIGPAADQGAIPGGHGCGAATMNMLGNNQQKLWPDCNPGFVHSTYTMLGKGHIDSMDAVVVESIVDLIVKARP